MSREIFVRFGLLRSRDAFEHIVAMLPEAEAEEARRAAAECSALPEPEVARQLAGLRAAGWQELRKRAEALAGTALDRLSPPLRDSLLASVGDRGRNG